MTQARRRNAKGKGDRLRGDIIAAAAALISERGREGLSLRAIARKAGVTAPAIYAHFRDLDEVQRAAIDYAFAEFTDFLTRHASASLTPADRLDALCHAYVRFGLERPAQYAVMFGYPMQSLTPRESKSIHTMPGAEAFALLVDAIRQCGNSREEDSAATLESAVGVWVSLHGYVGLRIAAPEFPWPPADTLLDVFVRRAAGLVPVNGAAPQGSTRTMSTVLQAGGSDFNRTPS